MGDTRARPVTQASRGVRWPGGAWLPLAITLMAGTGAGAAAAGEADDAGPVPPMEAGSIPADGVAEAAGPGPERIGAFEACRQPSDRTEILVDRASRRLHQTVCGAALWFDGLFGEGDLDAARQSHGHVEVGASYSEFSGSRTEVRLIAHLRFPVMEQRLSAFVGVDDEEDFVRDRSEGQALRSRQREGDRESFLLGLGFATYTDERFRSELRVGVRDVGLPRTFVQNRFTYVPYSDERNRLILRLTPFWDNRNLFGVTAHTSFDRIIAEAFLLRWSTAATVTEAAPGTDWRSALILYQNLGGTRALAYEAFIRGASADPEPLGEYGLRTVYRHPLLGPRLIGRIELGYSWPRDDPALPREGAADIGAGLEMPFGEKPG